MVETVALRNDDGPQKLNPDSPSRGRIRVPAEWLVRVLTVQRKRIDRFRDEHQSVKRGTGSFVMGARIGTCPHPPITDPVNSRGRINIVVLKCEVFPIFHCELFR